MNDAEFRRRAHALLMRMDPRRIIGPHEAAINATERFALIAAGAEAERKPVCTLVTGCARPAGHVGAHFMDWGMDFALDCIAPRNEPAGAMGCDPSGRPGNDAEVDRGGDARPAAAGNIAPDRTIAPDSAFAPDDAEARKAHPCRHPVIISKRNGLPLSYCGRPKGHAGPHME